MSDMLKKMKQESEDSPSRTDDVPLPPAKLIDVVNEIRTLQELRQKIVQKPASCPSICSYTLHNTYDGYVISTEIFKCSIAYRALPCLPTFPKWQRVCLIPYFSSC